MIKDNPKLWTLLLLSFILFIIISKKHKKAKSESEKEILTQGISFYCNYKLRWY